MKKDKSTMKHKSNAETQMIIAVIRISQNHDYLRKVNWSCFLLYSFMKEA